MSEADSFTVRRRHSVLHRGSAFGILHVDPEGPDPAVSLGIRLAADDTLIHRVLTTGDEVHEPGLDLRVGEIAPGRDGYVVLHPLDAP